jgi:hypothetical protein
MNIRIDDADIELVLDAHDEWRDTATLNDYFTAFAYPKATRLERDAALVLMRRAWVAALSRPGMPRRLKPSHARGYVRRQETIVRDTMNGIDQLPVTPLRVDDTEPAAVLEERGTRRSLLGKTTARQPVAAANEREWP